MKSKQLNLFSKNGSDNPEPMGTNGEGVALARTDDPETSHAAAHSVKGEIANDLEGKVLSVLVKHADGMTGQEVTDILGMDRVTTSPRFAPLKRKGLIYDSGARRAGPTGRMAIVWKAK